MDERMEEKMQELAALVAELARKYTGCDSSSISYEKAQSLMEAVRYCMAECEQSSAYAVAGKELSPREQYTLGTKLVIEKADNIRKLFNELSPWFEDYGVECLRDTVQRGIPEFLKWYDPKFCPQDTILTLDYPVLSEVHSLTGADAVYAYLYAIWTEQRFLTKFDRDYVETVLKKANPVYGSMMENVGSLFLMNLLGHLVIGKPFSEFGFSRGEYGKLKNLLEEKCVGELEELVRDMTEKLVEELYEGDVSIREYLCLEAENLAVRIDTAVQNNQLDKVFVL